jgi:hypothetical protein
MKNLDERGAVALTAFQTKTRRQMRECGDPSYRTIARRSYELTKSMHRKELLLSSSTVFRMVNGTHKPSWQSVESLMLCLGVSEIEIEKVWRVAWVELMDILRPIADSALSEYDAEEGADQAASGVECELCGAWVTNPELHAQWHKQNGAVNRRLRIAS